MQLQCRRFTSRGSQRSAFWRRTPHIEVASSPFFSPPHETILLSSSSLTWSCLYDPPPPPRIVHRAALRTGSCTGRYPRLSSCVCGSSPARQGRPCCCVEVVLVGVDVSLVVGSRAATKSWDTSGSHFSFFFFFVSFSSAHAGWIPPVWQQWPSPPPPPPPPPPVNTVTPLWFNFTVALLDGWSEDEGGSVPFGITRIFLFFFQMSVFGSD